MTVIASRIVLAATISNTNYITIKLLIEGSSHTSLSLYSFFIPLFTFFIVQSTEILTILFDGYLSGLIPGVRSKMCINCWKNGFHTSLNNKKADLIQQKNTENGFTFTEVLAPMFTKYLTLFKSVKDATVVFLFLTLLKIVLMRFSTVNGKHLTGKQKLVKMWLIIVHLDLKCDHNVF